MKWIGPAVGIFVGVVAMSAAGPANAQAQEHVNQAKTGQPLAIYHVFNCVTHHPSSQASAYASHGTVTVERKSGSSCGHPDEPLLVFTYVSDPDFKGDDGVTIYVSDSKFFTRVHVE